MFLVWKKKKKTRQNPKKENKKKQEKEKNEIRNPHLGQGHDREAPDLRACREEGEGLLERRRWGRRGSIGSCSSSSSSGRSSRRRDLDNLFDDARPLFPLAPLPPRSLPFLLQPPPLLPQRRPRPLDGPPAHDVRVQRQHHEAAGHDRRHQRLHLRAVADDAVGRAVEERERLSRGGLPDVGAEAEHRVQGRGLVERRRLVGEAPEQERENDVAPELGRAVEEREGPVAHHADEPGQARGQRRGGARGLLAKVKRLVVGVGEPERGVEGQEGAQHRVEERLPRQPLRRGAVGEQEQERAGPDGVHGQEGDDVGPAAAGGDDEGVAQGVEDGVVEGHEEEAAVRAGIFFVFFFHQEVEELGGE